MTSLTRRGVGAGSEQSVEVMKVTMGEVMEVGEVVSWKHRAMVERVGHAKVVRAAEAVHTTKAVHAAHHRVG
jgi:hypothetical protein